jgi:hypothetical protein
VCTSSFPSLVASQSASSRACSLFKKIKKYMLYFCEEERERDALLSPFYFLYNINPPPPMRTVFSGAEKKEKKGKENGGVS